MNCNICGNDDVTGCDDPVACEIVALSRMMECDIEEGQLDVLQEGI